MPPQPQILTRQCIEINSQPEPNSGCWLWLGAIVRGYGRIRREQKTYNAHRASFIVHKGDPGSLLIRHLCNNTFCVNPDHLKAGTDYDNAQDRVQAGRSRSTKFLASHAERQFLTENDKQRIKALKRVRKSDKYIAEIFGVSRQTVQRYK